MKTLLICFVSLFYIQYSYADERKMEKWKNGRMAVTNLPTFHYSDSIPDTLFADSIKTNKKENKKIIAAILSFPVPFGILGLHRIYLGTKPYMPFVYLGTVGGCMGILPLIDFITILTSGKESLNRFENNPKVFMWSH